MTGSVALQIVFFLTMRKQYAAKKLSLYLLYYTEVIEKIMAL